MCGIACIIGSAAKLSTMQNMLKSQIHRGPDFTGTYIEDNQIALGHS